jgi:predicted TIM-barrel fold metal-dependent hydrolase
MNIINCHTHIFNRNSVPVRFLPLWLKPVAHLLSGKNSSKKLVNLLNFFGRKNLSQLVQKYNHFLTIGDLRSQLEIFKLLQDFYPEGTKFCVLTMDMEYMSAGRVPKPFIQQLEELAAIKRDPAYKDLIYPFIFAHPDRPMITTLVRRYIAEENFAGIKLYPPLGYYPFDKRLDLVYQFAEENNIPITTHCARGGVFYKGKITERKHPITGKEIKEQKNKFFTDTYTDPENYKYVLHKFPKLKINLAHFGGFDEWKKYLQYTIVDNEGETNWFVTVKNLLKTYSNTFSDVSYTLYDASLIPLLKTVLIDSPYREKVLFGSDYYMVEQEESEREFSINLRAGLGEEDYKMIAQNNPGRFLLNNFNGL